MKRIILKLRDRLIFNTLNQNEGVAVLAVVILISLFLILGTAIAIVSMANFKHAYVLKGSNQAFYLNDGIIEECLNEIDDMSYNAEKYASYVLSGAYNILKQEDGSVKNIFEAFKTDDFKDTFLGTEQWEVFMTKLDDDYKNGTISGENVAIYLQRALRCEFLKRYYQYLLYGDNTITTKAKYKEFSKPNDNLDGKFNQVGLLQYDLVEKENEKWEYVFDLDDDEKEFFGKCLKFKIKNGTDTNPALNDDYTDKLKDVKLSKLVEDNTAYKNTDTVKIISNFNTIDELNATIHADNPRLKIKSDHENIYGLDISITTNGEFSQFKKPINVNVRMIEPEYSYIIKSENIATPYPKNNEVRNYGLISGSFIMDTGKKPPYFGGSSVGTEVKGSVYAYGVFGKNKDDVQSSAGIVAGLREDYCDKGAFLDEAVLKNHKIPSFIMNEYRGTYGRIGVTGNLITRSDILINDGSQIQASEHDGIAQSSHEDNQWLKNWGNVMAGNIKLLVDNNFENAAGRLFVFGNVYAMEDIVMRGAYSTIFFRDNHRFNLPTGQLYLILDYATKNNIHSGAIIVDKEVSSYGRMNPSKVFISGVAFSKLKRKFKQYDANGSVLDEKDVHFMTGESVNVENRYIDFYKPSTGNNQGLGYNATRYGTEVNPNTGEMNGPQLIDNLNDNGVDDIKLKRNLFMNNAGVYNENLGKYTSDNIEEKHKIALRISNINETAPAAEIKEKLKENYALGAVLFNNRVLNPEYMMDYNTYRNMLEQDVLATYDTAFDVDRRINLLKTRNISEDTDEVWQFIDNTKERVHANKFKRTTDNNSRLTQLIDFSNENNIVKMHPDNYDRAYRVCIVNNDPSRPIFISPHENDIPTIQTEYPNAIIVPATRLTYKGIILTMGDVYGYADGNNGVYDNIKLKGMIAAEGHIVFYGAGGKHINCLSKALHNGRDGGQEEIVKTMMNYPEAYRALHGSDGRKIINLMGGSSEHNDMKKIQQNFNMDDIQHQIGADVIYSITYGKVPLIITVPDKSNVEGEAMANPPIFEGIQRAKDMRGYKVISWKEMVP